MTVAADEAWSFRRRRPAGPRPRPVSGRPCCPQPPDKRYTKWSTALPQAASCRCPPRSRGRSRRRPRQYGGAWLALHAAVWSCDPGYRSPGRAPGRAEIRSNSSELRSITSAERLRFPFSNSDCLFSRSFRNAFSSIFVIVVRPKILILGGIVIVVGSGAPRSYATAKTLCFLVLPGVTFESAHDQPTGNGSTELKNIARNGPNASRFPIGLNRGCFP